MKFFILFSLVLFPLVSEASFNRLWVGFKKSEVTTTAFLNGLNQSFFKETIEVGGGKGLLAYQPFVTSMAHDLPDEIALVTYASEEAYKAIRSTPAGAAYGERHWDYFDKTTSKSTVSVPYQGELVEASAYELYPSFVDWSKWTTVVTIYQRTSKTDLKQIAGSWESLRKASHVLDSVIFIGKNSIIEYRSVKKATLNENKLPLKVLESRVLASHTLETKPTVGFSDGINFLF